MGMAVITLVITVDDAAIVGIDDVASAIYIVEVDYRYCCY